MDENFGDLKRKKIQTILETGQVLNGIQDIDVLLERILTETRKIVNADAGSVYVVEENHLKIKYAQNDTHLRALPSGEKLPYISFSFPISENSIAGYVALTGKPLNIPDAYSISSDMPFHFNKDSDIATNYRTRSIFTFPLKNASGKVIGVMQIINAQDASGNVISFDSDSELYISHFAASVENALKRARITGNMVLRMLRMAEFRDPKETYGHVERVSNFSVEIYDRWAFNHNVPENESHRFRDSLKIAAKFHDVGKVAISDIILKKTFPRFTPEERAVMQGHTVLGAKLFDPPESFLDTMCRDVAFHHHEWFDGSERGYPGECQPQSLNVGEPLTPARRLSGDEIPLAARIVAVADVFDALSQRRCYKEEWDFDAAFKEIENCSGTQFDPEVVKAFVQIRNRIMAIREDFKDKE